MPSHVWTSPENHPTTNITTLTMISHLTAGEIPPGPKAYDKPDGEGDRPRMISSLV
jgi:hypothetical protein